MHACMHKCINARTWVQTWYKKFATTNSRFVGPREHNMHNMHACYACMHACMHKMRERGFRRGTKSSQQLTVDLSASGSITCIICMHAMHACMLACIKCKNVGSDVGQKVLAF